MDSVPSVVWLVALLVATPYAYYRFQLGRRRKSHLAFTFRRKGIALIAYLGAFYVWMKSGHPWPESLFVAFVVGIAAGFLLVKAPKRNRTIPAHVKRAVIQRDLGSTPYDPKLHHIDHIVPYSHNGDHSVANLRVISKTDNLRRGARKPRFRELL